MPSPSGNVLRCTNEKILARKRDCPERSRSGRETRDDISWCGTDSPSTGCHRKREDGYGSWSLPSRPGGKQPARAHRGATIGMQGELTGEDALFGATVLDEPLRQFGTFAHGNHPAGDVATEHIENHVEVEVRPFRGT